jgi:hypothetical protein
MRKTQIDRPALMALWQGILLQGVLLVVVILVWGSSGPLQAYCAALVAQLATTAGILIRRAESTTKIDRLMIRIGILPLWGIAYLALPWIMAGMGD